MSTETQINSLQMIGRYHIISEIGRGGMGVVYRAEDRLIGRQVAIKTLTEVTPELRERFYIEARSGMLNHPNIVTVYELGEHENSPFIAMEFIDGRSLEQFLREEQRISLLDALSIAEQLCTGLGHAHQNGVVHRDVKPANVLVRPDGRVTIVDFGIARLADQTHQLTKTDTLLGTFHYISPERLKGEQSDGQADIWSVGVILYEMLTGQLPFRGGDISSLYRVIHEPYTPLVQHMQELPEDLNRIFDRALAKRVEDRYATAEEMAVDLQLLIESLQHDRVGTLLETARRMLREEEYTGARAAIVRVQRLDVGNKDAKNLLRELQQKQREPVRTGELRSPDEPAETSAAREPLAGAEKASRPDHATGQFHTVAVPNFFSSPVESKDVPKARPDDEQTQLTRIATRDLVVEEGDSTTFSSLRAISDVAGTTIGKDLNRDSEGRSAGQMPHRTAKSARPPEQPREEDVSNKTSKPAKAEIYSGSASIAAQRGRRESKSSASSNVVPATAAKPKQAVQAQRGASRRSYILLASGGLIALLCGIVFMGSRHNRPVPALQVALTKAVAHAPGSTPPVEVVSKTDVQINADPWAHVLSMKDSHGAPFELPPGDQITPVRIEQVPVGIYQITYLAVDGRERTAECNVSADHHLCSVSFSPFDMSQLLKGDQP